MRADIQCNKAHNDTSRQETEQRQYKLNVAIKGVTKTEGACAPLSKLTKVIKIIADRIIPLHKMTCLKDVKEGHENFVAGTGEQLHKP